MANTVTTLDLVKGSREYDLISEFYAGKSAKRSGRPYMAHIDEGLSFMSSKLMTVASMKAYCLHPLFQADEDLANFSDMVKRLSWVFDNYVLMLVMEYRNCANRYTGSIYNSELYSYMEPELSPLPEVNDMLRADKVQNFSDYLKYHYEKTPVKKYSKPLKGYFEMWLDRLDVTYRVVKVEDSSNPYYLLEVK